MSNLTRLLESLLLNEGYYGKDEFKSLEDTISRWQKAGDKMFDDNVHAFVKLEDILPYKEYERSRERGRNSPEEWDELVASMKEKGWNPKSPLHMFIGKQGGAKVGEGNHRLAIAKQLGIQEIPVQFHFVWDKVVKDKVPEIYRESAGDKSSMNKVWFSGDPGPEVKRISKDIAGSHKSANCQLVCKTLAKRLSGLNYDVEIHHGTYKDEGHTWLEVEGSIVDPTADQFDDYPNLDEFEYTDHEIETLNENKEIDPEDYRIAHRAPGKEDNSPMYDVCQGGTYPKDFYTLPLGTVARYYGAGDNDDALLVNLIWNVHNKPKAQVKIYRAVSKEKSLAEKIAEFEDKKREHLRRGKLPPTNKMSHEEARAAQGGKSVWYNWVSGEIEKLQHQLATKGEPEALNITRINPGDWITITRKYAIEHGESALNGEYKILTKTVPAKTLWTNGDSLYEFGYNP